MTHESRVWYAPGALLFALEAESLALVVLVAIERLLLQLPDLLLQTLLGLAGARLTAKG